MNAEIYDKILLFLQSTLWNITYTANTLSDWTTISKLSQEQGVTAFIYDGIKKSGIKVPYEIEQTWKKHIFSSAFQNERLLVAQSAVIYAFKQANIPVAVLKGSSSARYYPQPELRALGDIDLLINKSILPFAKEILLQIERMNKV